MRYTVLVPFSDGQDNGYHYETGDLFPRLGLEVSKERIAELLSDNNASGNAVIKKEAKKG